MILVQSVLVFVLLSACSIRQGETLSASDRSECLDSSVPGARDLIVGGEIGPRDKWPWLVALFADNKIFCAGSLISERFVLTAAHCIQSKKEEEQPRDPKDVNVYLGKWNLSDATEQDVVLATPVEFIVHHDWNVTDKNWDADIAIAKLAGDVTFSRSVQPVCLWTSQMQPDEADDGGIVVGWGQTEVDGKHSDIPEEAKVLRLPIEDCNEADGLSQVMSGRGLCTKGIREAACSGDYGGGFFTAQGGKWFLRGIRSMSRLNAAMECDAIFTNVEKFIPWIDQVLDGDEPMKCSFEGGWLTAYGCNLQNSFTRRDTKIFQVSGSHPGRGTNAHVYHIKIEDNSELKFLPITTWSRFFPNLQQYRVINSSLKEISRNNFADLPKLNSLVINRTPLKVIPVDALYDLTNLEVFSLEVNQIEAIDSSTFIHNTKLRVIYLQRNKIASLDSATFRNNLELHLILFSNNLLTSIGPELLTPLGKLRLISFSNNPCIDKDWWSDEPSLTPSEKEEFKEMCADKCQ